MKPKKRGFTLIELLAVLAISGVLITISTNWYIKNVVSAGNRNNKNIDLQSGVSTSVDMIKNTLRKSTQVHLVGRNVYDPDLTIQELEARGLDKNYNYIAIYKDPATNEKILANLVYSTAESKFNVIPLVALDKQDQLNRNRISYSMEFYKGDADYKQKLDNKIVNITVKGVAKDVDTNGRPVRPENNKDFELSEDVFLPNSNQVLISRFFSGDLDDVTAIAYDSSRIVGERKVRSYDTMSFVFILDVSGSMDRNMTLSSGGQKTRINVAKESAKKFIGDLQQLAVDNNITINSYLFTFHHNTEYTEKELVDKGASNYLYDLNTLESKRYGPFQLGEGKSGKASLETKINSLRVNGATNTGLAILQGLEVLNQLRDRKATKEKRFFILLTDGEPTSSFAASYSRAQRLTRDDFVYSMAKYKQLYAEKVNNPGRRYYLDYYYPNKFGMSDDYDNYVTLAMDYIERVTDPSSEINKKETFDKAYLIGFSDDPDDKQRLGLSRLEDVPPANSIRAYMSRTTEGANKKMDRVQTFDASNEVSLNSTFDNITQDIGNVLGAFDGPGKLR